MTDIDENYEMLGTAVIAQAYKDLAQCIAEVYIIEHRTESDIIAHHWKNIYSEIRRKLMREYRQVKYKIEEDELKELCEERMKLRRDSDLGEIEEIKRFFDSDLFLLYSDGAQPDMLIKYANNTAMDYVSGKIEKLPKLHVIHARYDDD